MLLDEVPFSPQIQGTTRYHMGYVHFLKGDWASAAACFEDFLKLPILSTGPRFRSYTCAHCPICGVRESTHLIGALSYPAYQLGFCYWKLDRKDEIVPLYNRLTEWFRAHESYDIFAKRKIDRFLATKEFSRKDEIVIICSAICLSISPLCRVTDHSSVIDAYVEGKLFHKSLEMVEELYSIAVKANDRECKAIYHFIKGCALSGLLKFDEAKEQLRVRPVVY